MERLTLFADVLLPLPVKGTFTYRVPFELNDDIASGKGFLCSSEQKKYIRLL